ncbi:secretion-regulating guanine nucleotide exchange factor isoform X3 [Colossoma macropomum]|uniref:secretion-regulating guanine nucleotide exchange factor isoform X3 n=1 Tax=Colossoma macropomum TaxID=42526 RepID=UPI001863A70E|nr:secretion-regulating guanine nucleotide exchange factor isoform X3 [Colossoma macropomum]
MDTPRTKCALYTWGANSFGQLGQGHAEDQAEPQRVDGAQEQTRLRAITGGGGHSALITETGELLVCGQNHKGQLGLGHISDVTTFRLCPLPGSQTVQQVSCGWDFTILLTDDGHVLACGSNAFGQLGVSPEIKYTAEPLLIKSLSEPVISVATGLRHALAVTGSGGVYQWGTGLSAQAKRALNPQPVPVHLTCKEPHLVPGLNQVTCQKVAAGSAHSVCLTVAGDVFLWGSNKYGQLCSKESFLPLPTALDRSLLNGERVCAIHSGWTHLIAQTETERVFTWGRASYGQLGRRGPTNDVTSPESDASMTDSSSEISLPSEVRALNGATQIACGSEHNLAVVGNQVFSWGWNEHGMCGDGSFCNIIQPQLVPVLRDVRPLLIGCGAGHSMALCCLKSSGEFGC